MKLVPLGDKVVIKQLEAEEKTKSGLILTTQSQEKPQEAMVIAVGPGGLVGDTEVKMVLKEEKTNHTSPKKREEKRNQPEKIEVSKEELEQSKTAVETFLNEFVASLKEKQIQPSVRIEGSILQVNLEGENASEFIGYRGEVLNALQTLLSTIANKNHKAKVKVVVDIAGYKQRRADSGLTAGAGPLHVHLNRL